MPLDNRTGVRYGLREGGASLTKHDAARKQKIIDYIAATLRARGYPPSVREIAKAVGLASTSAVHHHLAALEREGYLERGATQSRAIRLTPTAALQAGLSAELVPQLPAHESFVLPVIGEIAAGGPIEAYQDASETLSVPDILAPSGDAYVLRVRGDSMIDAHIEDGDFVVIRPQQTAHNGDIVVAQVEENAVTLKRFFKDAPGRIRLQPANDQYPPQIYDDVRIQGKLIGVIRRLD
jgi:repressor LexA